MRLALLATALLAGRLSAQGMTTAAVQGSVADSAGAPVSGAIVRVVNTADGRRWEAVTAASGRFGLEDVAVGGPYRFEVRALGFAPQTRSAGPVLSLGQRLVVDFVVYPAAVELAAVPVSASADPILNSGRTGPAETVDRATIATLPNPGRDFLTLTLLSPQAASSPSSPNTPLGSVAIAGQNPLYNNYQIDGGTTGDLYLGELPGRQILPRPISLEAVDQLQVLTAPFDVRQAEFAGGMVNVVTKSGTNTVHGTAFSYFGNQALVGPGQSSDQSGGYSTWQFGAAVGGPIVHDRVHYLLSADLEDRPVPDPGDVSTAGISKDSAERFQAILRDSFHLEPGTLGPSDGRVQAQDLFGKLTWQLGTNSQLEMSHHYAHGKSEGFLTRGYGFYALTSRAEQDPTTTNASRVIWTSQPGGRWSNALIASFLRVSDTCIPNTGYSQLEAKPTSATTLQAGPTSVCPTNTDDQQVWGIEDNGTIWVGPQAFTFGAQGEALHFTDHVLVGSTGLWRFASLDSLEKGIPYHYEAGLPGPARTGPVDFPVVRTGAYVQDRWMPAHGLTLTAGLRLDVALLPKAVPTNDALKDSLGVDTGQLPSGNMLWSPRLGVNYDLGGTGETFIRGGVGLFDGPPPYRWLGNVYRDNGTQELFLTCDQKAAPRFDPSQPLPQQCADATIPAPQVSFFDPDFRFPQNLRVSLGVDHRLPGGVIGTVDLLYTRAVHQVYVSDVNLSPPVSFAAAEGGRPMYGTISSDGSSIITARPDSQYRQVIEVSNRDGDRAFSLAVQLRKQLSNRLEAQALYAYTSAQDRMSVVNYLARANFQGTPLDGTVADRNLTTSLFEIPHRLLIDLNVTLPAAVGLSLLYSGASGTPFTYLVQGDANADGVGTGMTDNDVVYVPRNAADITLKNPADWSALDAYIRSEPCLDRNRGRLLPRNSCRNPWFGTLNARVIRDFRTTASQSLGVVVDVYNVANLINNRWGQSLLTASGPTAFLLRLSGYDPVYNRGKYALDLPAHNQVQDPASRWQIQLGARYQF